MKRLIAVARKEMLHILRDPRSLTVAILMPLFMLILYGYAIDMDLKQLPIGLLDFDHSIAGRDLVREMTSGGFIIVAEKLANRSQIEPGFKQGRFRAALIIPVGYEAKLARDPQSPVQLIIDGADGTTAASAANYLNAAAARINRRLLTEATGFSRLPVEARTRVFYNPELVSANFIVPGLTALIMMMICALLTSIAITREKETGTMEQILTTPIAAPQVIIGKVLPYMGIAALDAALILLVGITVFHVPMNGSWLALAGYSFIFLLIALALGLLVSTVARTQQVAMMASLMVTLLPTLLLSGFVFSISSMPLVLQWISRIIPAMYYLRALRGIMLKGVNWHPLELAVMAGMAVFLLGVAMRRFKQTLE
ncbi:MAG: ABC transporter permease [Calditrichota bacterium]